MKSGQSFGELALINDAPRSATVTAIDNCEFAILHRNDYDKMIKRVENRQEETILNFFNTLPFLNFYSLSSLRKLVPLFS